MLERFLFLYIVYITLNSMAYFSSRKQVFERSTESRIASEIWRVAKISVVIG